MVIASDDRPIGSGTLDRCGIRRRFAHMRRAMIVSAVMLVALAMLGTVAAQAQQYTPQPSTTRPGAPPPAAAEVPKEVQVEGTVSKVDPLAKTVGVSTGFFGLLGATVQVADDTQIRVLGQPATLAEIKEGARVKASYEVREGRKRAKSIDVMAVEEQRPKGASRSPGSTPTQ
jgi:Cu/Ag efflux protein CusF